MAKYVFNRLYRLIKEFYLDNGAIPSPTEIINEVVPEECSEASVYSAYKKLVTEGYLEKLGHRVWVPTPKLLRDIKNTAIRHALEDKEMLRAIMHDL